MNKRINLKSFLLGVLVASLIAVLGIPALAASGYKTANLYYGNISIVMDGNQITPKDANGVYVEPFAIDGTTYLPVRAVSGALGLEVGWDQATSTVTLNTPSDGQRIYITRTGSKYHYDSHCNGGTYWEVPLETALGFGLKPCEKCVN